MNVSSLNLQSAAAGKQRHEERSIKKIIRELLLERRDNILIIKINRPQTKNALNRRAIYELIAAINEARHDEGIKLIVITGMGDIFSAGNDLKQMQEYGDLNNYFQSSNYILRAFVKTIIHCPKIIVCLVNGPAIGIGFTLCALCDIVYCTRNAYFQAPFTSLGICPEACSSLTFPQNFGTSWATNLLVFGEKLSAEDAKLSGFVAEVFEDLPDVEEKFWNKLKRYTELPEVSVRVTKRLMRSHSEDQILNALYAELKEIEKLRKGPAYQDAIRKFQQKSADSNKSKL